MTGFGLNNKLEPKRSEGVGNLKARPYLSIPDNYMWHNIVAVSGQI